MANFNTGVSPNFAAKVAPTAPKAAVAAPQALKQAPTAAPAATEPEQTEVTTKKERSPRLEYTTEMLQFVLDNSKGMTTKQIAEQLDINPLQVNAIRKNIQKSLRHKLAKKLDLKVTDLYASSSTEDGKILVDYDNPIHDDAKKLEEKINATFKRTKEKEFKTTSVSKQNINKIVEDFIGDL